MGFRWLRLRQSDRTHRWGSALWISPATIRLGNNSQSSPSDLTLTTPVRSSAAWSIRCTAMMLTTEVLEDPRCTTPPPPPQVTPTSPWCPRCCPTAARRCRVVLDQPYLSTWRTGIQERISGPSESPTIILTTTTTTTTITNLRLKLKFRIQLVVTSVCVQFIGKI